MFSLSFIKQAYAQGTPIGPIECDSSNPFCPQSQGEAISQTTNLINTIVGFLTVIAGLAFLIYFMIGAISWLTAGGDTGKVDTAKRMMTNAAIGLIIIAAAWAIYWLVGTVLGINVTDPISVIFGLTGGSGSNPPIPPPPPVVPGLP